MRISPRTGLVAALLTLAVACVVPAGPGGLERHRWWAGLGPVLPHDTFPADCRMCHAGSNWNELVDGFEFDHEAQTGYRLDGAHAGARCLRCHNDRGPVDTFAAQGCAGCHEDPHLGTLDRRCDTCHDEQTWYPSGMVARHNRTRFPLLGAHASTQCRRCHQGSDVGVFLPTDTDCVTCHADDLARTTNHIGLGWVDRCDRCHRPTNWPQAEVF